MSEYKVLNSTLDISDAEKQAPGSYWVRVRGRFPLVGSVMLWWLTAASPVLLEGGFSLVTMLGASSRRRRLEVAKSRALIMGMIHKEWLLEELGSRVSAGSRVGSSSGGGGGTEVAAGGGKKRKENVSA
jgi:uncharacterized membrane protein YgcG